jgi:poly(3-hydroxybutyrate) depolymerase
MEQERGSPAVNETESRRSWRFWYVILAILATLLLGLGVGLAVLAHNRPEVEATVRTLTGLFFLGTGLAELFHLAAYGPKPNKRDRVDRAFGGTAMVLIGAAQLIASRAVSGLLAISAVVCLVKAMVIRRRLKRAVRALVLAPIVAALPSLSVNATSQTPQTTTFDETIPPGANFDKAEFRLWMPANLAAARAIVVLVPGSNGDGRPMAADAFWQAFATKHSLALVGCRFTDKPHDQSFIEDYVNVSKGSGQALLDVLTSFATTTKHPELAHAPLFLWGMSAGGQFNYEFVAWMPERVAAFIVNKGGIYYSALLSRAAREVPGILFTGEKDLDSRVNTISGLFAVNRRGGALWALAQEPGAAHVVGRSRDMGALLFEEVLPLRVPDGAATAGPVALKPIDPKSGFIGDLKAMTTQPIGEAGARTEATVWLATSRLARAWVAVVTGAPFQ